MTDVPGPGGLPAPPSRFAFPDLDRCAAGNTGVPYV